MRDSRQNARTSSSSTVGDGSSVNRRDVGVDESDMGCSSGAWLSEGPAASGRARAALPLALVLLGFKASPARAAAPPSTPDDARGSLAVYCPDTCGSLDLGSIKIRSRLPAVGRFPVAVVDRWGGEQFGLPDQQAVANWGRGDVAGVQEAGEVIVVRWATTRGRAAETLSRVGASLAAAGPWIEDLETGWIYDAASWATAMERTAARPADVTALMLIEHEAGEGGEQASESSSAPATLRTVGLRRLGLPELLLEDVPADRVGELGIALNAIAQSTYEVTDGGYAPQRVAVDASRLASVTAAEGLCSARGEATLRATRRKLTDTVPVARVEWRGELGECGAQLGPDTAEGLPSEPESTGGVALAMPVEAEAEGAEPAAAETAALGAPPADVTPNSLRQARALSSARLDTEVRARFAAGEQGTLMVKAPFQAEDGAVEYLWLVVDDWSGGDVLRGRMANEPVGAVGVSKGDVVEAELGLVYDYLWTWPDGRKEGNTTAAFLDE